MAKKAAVKDIVINNGKNKTVIKRNAGDTQPLEILAEEISKVAKAAKTIADSKLEKRAILLLIRDLTKLPMEHIELVLRAAEDLETFFIKKQK